MDGKDPIRLLIDDDLCLGARQCSFIAPDVFSHADDGTAIVEDARNADIDVLIEAAKICPNFAITLEVNGEIVHQGG